METQLFDPSTTLHYHHRKNRFVLVCTDDEGASIECHVANPGRMWEFLEEGSILAVEKLAPHNKLPYRAVAVRYKDSWVPLESRKANLLARDLVLPQVFPGVKLIPEPKIPHGRADFLVLMEDSSPIYIEVKSCSLVEEGIAMFPDAPSERATRHIQTLAQLPPSQGTTAKSKIHRHMVLWIITHGHSQALLPNVHTDPDFARAVFDAKNVLDFCAVAIHCDDHGWARVTQAAVPIDFHNLQGLLPDRGSYFLGIEVAADLTLRVAKREFTLKAGWYVYVGSAMGGLQARIKHHLERHTRAKSKKTLKEAHWHMDHLGPLAKSMQAYPIRAPHPLEETLVTAMEGLPGAIPVPGFGASDSPRDSHLFWVPTCPHLWRPFSKILFTARHRWCLELPS